MVSLTNQARLLAAQEFNRRVLEQKAREGRKITTSSSRVGVLTGRKPLVKRGKVVGVSKQKSKTRLQTENLLRKEIQRQQELRSKESDLEKFLKNERRLASGNITRAELNRQIAARKAKGLSKTPAQKRALALFTQAGSRAALQTRAIRKAGRGRKGKQIVSPNTLLRTLQSEEERAGQLGSAPFADPLFSFGGRSRQEVIDRGGTFGRRAGGESASQQLAFVSGARKATASARINFAQSLLGGFGGASSGELLSIVGSQVSSRDPTKRGRGARTQIPLAPPTFEQVLRADQGLFTTKAVPVTKAKITKAERKALVKTRKAEDFAKAQVSRKQIAEARRETAKSQRENLSSIEALGIALDKQNRARAVREFGFGRGGQVPAPRGDSGVVVLGSQVIEPATPKSRLDVARQTQLETEALRAQGGLRAGDIPDVFGRDALSGLGGISLAGAPSLVRATGAPKQTRTFEPTFRETTIRSSDFSDVFSGDVGFTEQPPEPKPKKTKTKKPSKTTRPEEIAVLGSQVIEPAGQQDQGLFGNIFGGLQSFFGGAPLVESRSAGVSVGVGEALTETADLFDIGGADVVETGRGLAQGELLEGISISEAVGASPLGSGTDPIGNFLSNLFR